jgi:hypothetical protein
MTRLRLYGGFAVAELIAWRAGVAWLIVTSLAGVGVYAASLRLNPRVPHRACGGRGWHRGRLFAWTSHRCGGICGGTGVIIRAGARLLGTQDAQAEAAMRRTPPGQKTR